MWCGSLDGRGVWGGMDTCIWISESLCCPPETIITLLSAIHQYKIQRKKKYWSRFPFPTLWNPGIKPVCLASPALAGWFFITMPTGKPHNAVLLSHKKKKETMPSAPAWMDLETVILSEVGQTENDTYMCYHLYVKSKEMLQMNLFTKKKQSHTRRKQTYGYRGRRWVGDKWGDWGWHIHTTVVEQAISKNLQHSPGNYAQVCNHLHGNKS